MEKNIDIKSREMYHTQEHKNKKLTFPVLCTKSNAWLGTAYYFWYDEIDAINWGNDFKGKNGYFEIYNANIDTNDILDTVFNEEHYKFWLSQIEKTAKKIFQLNGRKATIKDINQYLKEKANWQENITGVMFQDIPIKNNLMVEQFYYRKRIQLAVYKKEIIKNFKLKEVMEKTK